MGCCLQGLSIAALVLLAGCTTVKVESLPLADRSTLHVVTITAWGLTGPKTPVIDRWQYDPRTDKETFIQGDALAPASGTTFNVLP